MVGKNRKEGERERKEKKKFQRFFLFVCLFFVSFSQKSEDSNNDLKLYELHIKVRDEKKGKTSRRWEIKPLSGEAVFNFINREFPKSQEAEGPH